MPSREPKVISDHLPVELDEVISLKLRRMRRIKAVRDIRGKVR